MYFLIRGSLFLKYRYPFMPFWPCLRPGISVAARVTPKTKTSALSSIDGCTKLASFTLLAGHFDSDVCL